MLLNTPQGILTLPQGALSLNGVVPSSNRNILYEDFQKPLGGTYEYQILPESVRPDWTAIKSPHTVGSVVTIPAGTSNAAAQATINAAASGSIIRFDVGTYNWTDTVEITTGDRTIELPAGVEINMDIPAGWERYAFWVKGSGATGSSLSITDGIGLHSRELTVSDASSLSVGDWVRVDIPFRSRTYTSANQWTLGNGVEVNRKCLIAQIESKNGNTLTLDRKVAMPPEWNLYPSYAVLQKINLIENVVIKGAGEISYTNALGSTVGNTSINNAYEDRVGFGNTVIMVQNALRCCVSGITLRDAPTTMIWLKEGSHNYVEGPQMLGAHNTSQGGCGYDVACEGQSVFRLENLHSERTRHGAPATSLNRSNTCGYVHYTYLETNIDFHGAGDWGIVVYVEDLNSWHGSSSFRNVDLRSRRTLNWNHVFFKGMTQSNPTNYDSIYSTYGDGDITFVSVPLSSHDPGYRILPGAKFSGDVGFAFTAGHMSSWIISTSGPSLTTINPGIGTLTVSDVYGGAIMIPDPGAETLQRTIAGFALSNTGDTTESSILIIASGLNGITDYTTAYAAISDVNSNARLDLGGGNYVELSGITKAQLSERHIKVVDSELLRYWQGRNYMRHFFLGDRPYLRTCTPMINTSNAGPSTEVSHTFSRNVTHNSSAGDAYVLNEDGSIFHTINPATDISISGAKVTYTIPGMVAGNWYRFEIPPNYFQDGSSLGIMPIYDWDSEERPAYYQRNLHYWQA